MARASINLEFKFSNLEAVYALSQSIELVQELKQDLPWRDELSEIGDKLTMALESIDVVET